MMGHQDDIHTDRLGFLMEPVSIVKVFSDDPEKIKKTWSCFSNSLV